MRDHREAAGLVDPRDRLFDGLEGRDRLLHPQREHVPLQRGDLDARDQLEAPAFAGALVRLARLKGAAYVVVVGDGDDVEEGVSLDTLEDGQRVVHAVAKGSVHLEVGATEEGRLRGWIAHCCGS